MSRHITGCGRSVFVDGHHLQHWARGGETKLGNLIQVCHPHHVLIHEGGFGVEAAGDGFVFRRPDGCIIEEAPQPVPIQLGEEAVRARNLAAGLQIGPQAAMPSAWDDPVDYGAAVQVLLPRKQRRAGAPGDGSNPTRMKTAA